MHESSEFKADTTISLLLVGEPGTGKTNVAMSFPNPYFLSTDHKLGNAMKLHRGKKFFFDYVDVDIKTGAQLAPELRWKNLVALILANCGKPEIDTIVLDNLSDVGDWLQAYIISQPALSAKGRPNVAGEKIMEQADWQPYYVLLSNLIHNLKQFGKTVVVCAHEAVDKDEVQGTLKYYPRVGGKLRDTLPSMFTNVWQTAVVQTGADSHRYFVRTKPTPRMVLINSLGLPAEFNFEWTKVKEAIEANK